MNRIDVAIQSANVDESNRKLLNLCLHNESARTNVSVVVNCHGYLRRGSATVILRLEVVKHIRPQKIKRDGGPGDRKATLGSCNPMGIGD